MISNKDLFGRDYTIYWPEKYEPIVDFLKNGTHGSTGDLLFRLNVDVIVMSACIGLKLKIKCPVGDKRKDISLQTFNGKALSIYLYLIPLLAGDDLDLSYLSAEDGELRAISVFQEYAAGGLQYLTEEYASSGLKTPFAFMRDLLYKLNSKDVPHKVATDLDVVDMPLNLFGSKL